MPEMNVVGREEAGRGKSPRHITAMNRLGWYIYLTMDPPRWGKDDEAGFLRYVNFEEERFYLVSQFVESLMKGQTRKLLAILLGRSDEEWEGW